MVQLSLSSCNGSSEIILQVYPSLGTRNRSCMLQLAIGLVGLSERQFPVNHQGHKQLLMGECSGGACLHLPSKSGCPHTTSTSIVIEFLESGI